MSQLQVTNYLWVSSLAGQEDQFDFHNLYHRTQVRGDQATWKILREYAQPAEAREGLEVLLEANILVPADQPESPADYHGRHRYLSQRAFLNAVLRGQEPLDSRGVRGRWLWNYPYSTIKALFNFLELRLPKTTPWPSWAYDFWRKAVDHPRSWWSACHMVALADQAFPGGASVSVPQHRELVKMAFELAGYEIKSDQVDLVYCEPPCGKARLVQVLEEAALALKATPESRVFASTYEPLHEQFGSLGQAAQALGLLPDGEVSGCTFEPFPDDIRLPTSLVLNHHGVPEPQTEQLLSQPFLWFDLYQFRPRPPLAEDARDRFLALVGEETEIFDYSGPWPEKSPVALDLRRPQALQYWKCPPEEVEARALSKLPPGRYWYDPETQCLLFRAGGDRLKRRWPLFELRADAVLPRPAGLSYVFREPTVAEDWEPTSELRASGQICEVESSFQPVDLAALEENTEKFLADYLKLDSRQMQKLFSYDDEPTQRVQMLRRLELIQKAMMERLGNGLPSWNRPVEARAVVAASLDFLYEYVQEHPTVNESVPWSYHESRDEREGLWRAPLAHSSWRRDLLCQSYGFTGWREGQDWSYAEALAEGDLQEVETATQELAPDGYLFIAAYPALHPKVEQLGRLINTYERLGVWDGFQRHPISPEFKELVREAWSLLKLPEPLLKAVEQSPFQYSGMFLFSKPPQF